MVHVTKAFSVYGGIAWCMFPIPTDLQSTVLLTRRVWWLWLVGVHINCTTYSCVGLFCLEVQCKTFCFLALQLCSVTCAIVQGGGGSQVNLYLRVVWRNFSCVGVYVNHEMCTHLWRRHYAKCACDQQLQEDPVFFFRCDEGTLVQTTVDRRYKLTSGRPRKNKCKIFLSGLEAYLHNYKINDRSRVYPKRLPAKVMGMSSQFACGRKSALPQFSITQLFKTSVSHDFLPYWSGMCGNKGLS